MADDLKIRVKLFSIKTLHGIGLHVLGLHTIVTKTEIIVLHVEFYKSFLFCPKRLLINDTIFINSYVILHSEDWYIYQIIGIAVVTRSQACRLLREYRINWRYILRTQVLLEC